MILFFRTPSKSVIAVESNHQLTPDESNKLCWLFGEAVTESEENLKGCFVGPRREMITPWSTNAVEITQNMGLEGITRIEEYFPVKDENADHDPMLQRMYKGLDQNVFTTTRPRIIGSSFGHRKRRNRTARYLRSRNVTAGYFRRRNLRSRNRRHFCRRKLRPRKQQRYKQLQGDRRQRHISRRNG